MNLPPSSSFLESVPLLLCEGDSDERFLDRIFNTRELKAQQVGGVGNLRPAAAYLTRQNQPVFTIQDRDFRPLSEAEECYDPNYADRHFMWRRHELENYLIEPRVVANCFKQLQPHSRVTLPDTEDSARHWIRNLAQDLLEDQAGHRTSWELRHQLHDTFPTTSSRSQGNAIQNREEWNRDSSFLQPNDFDALGAAIRRLTGV